MDLEPSSRPSSEALPGLPLAPGQEILELADWRRRVFELYAEVRARAGRDPRAAWDLWRREREDLFRRHRQSPVPGESRSAFRALHFSYDPALRFEVPLEVEHASAEPLRGSGALALPLSTAPEAPLAFDRVGWLDVPFPGRPARLALYRLRDYAGGLFLPFRDATAGTETYGAGRYLLDTAKGADLGAGAASGSLVLDFNFAFQPSCAFDPRWACPLAPPENALPFPIRGGERIA